MPFDFVDLPPAICYTESMNTYSVRQFRGNRAKDGSAEVRNRVEVSVPASKSILNRALLLAALANGSVLLRCGSWGEDTTALLSCLSSLGIATEPCKEGILVHGCGGKIPNRSAELDVMSAGTAARFLPALLAVCGGDYRFRSSEQMSRRPMEHLRLLEEAGARFEYDAQPVHFPFRMISSGIDTDLITVNTDESTQYASGLLIAASARKKPLTLRLTGSRTGGSYIQITLSLLKAFSVPVSRNGTELTVSAPASSPKEFAVEADISGACYFYALSLLFGIQTLVHGVRRDTVQGDARFLDLLAARGVRFTDTSEGLLADGSGITSYRGFCEDLSDFSDQTLTVAALAPFASSPSVLKNVGHIRKQECDRIAAICENLTALGVSARSDGDNIYIQPSEVKGGLVRTYRDHRVAMAFTLIGLKTGSVTIENPDCCKKTFDNFFELIDRLVEAPSSHS